MHQTTVEAISRELEGLEVSIATDVETRIAKILIGCGFLKIVDHEDHQTFESTWKE